MKHNGEQKGAGLPPGSSVVKPDCIKLLQGKLIVSCQDYTIVMLKAAIRGGAAGLRINSPHDVRTARKMTAVPIVACNKMYFPNSPIYITPSVRAATALIDAGANFVALDCTNRKRVRETPAEIIRAIHAREALAVADLATLDEAKAAIDAGADVVATTLAPKFDASLIAAMAKLGKPVLAEGHVDNPDLARQAIEAGAWAVCVGTAITRPHLLTEQFRNAIGA